MQQDQEHSTAKSSALAALKARRQNSLVCPEPQTEASRSSTQAACTALEETSSTSRCPAIPSPANPHISTILSHTPLPPPKAPLKDYDSQASNDEQAQHGLQQPVPSAATGAAAAPRRMRAWAWVCTACKAECVPIRTESRCLCGHRLKDHGKLAQTGPVTETSRCNAARCKCDRFFYIVAEGSWVLHCRCKHKHTDHDAATHKCTKPGCKRCDKFHSPWVCNCDHPWAEHVQQVVERDVKSVEQLMAEACIAEDVNRHDLIQRGLEEA